MFEKNDGFNNSKTEFEQENNDEKIVEEPFQPLFSDNSAGYDGKRSIAERLKKITRIKEIKEKLGIREGGAEKEKIQATPENIALFLEYLGPEYKRFLMEEFSSGQKWFAENGEDAFPYCCQRSSKILGNILPEIFDLKIGDGVDLAQGRYICLGQPQPHTWINVTINGDSYCVDALLSAQMYYLGRKNKASKALKGLEGKAYFTARDRYFGDTLNNMPSDIMFVPYGYASSELGVKRDKEGGMFEFERSKMEKIMSLPDDLSIGEKEELIRNYWLANPDPITKKGIDDFRKDKGLNRAIKQAMAQIKQKSGADKPNFLRKSGSRETTA